MKTTTIRKIALSQLEIAPENARKSQPSADADAGLAASIAAHGLKQNLGVYAGENDTFYVHAGGRRLRALRVLAETGVIDTDYKVPCVVDDAGDATEMSLVENVMRVAMHPADEFAAFAALIAGGAGEEDVAGRFGTTVIHVKKRMKLAAVAPEIVAKYREDVITLETLMAFTLSDSHDRQREVWAMIEPNLQYGGSPAYQVKHHLTEARVAGSSRLARFVGVERYEAAGGTVTRDLFSDKESIWFDDPRLLETLATTMLEEQAEDLCGEWKWVEVMLDMPWQACEPFGRIYPEPQDADPAIAAELREVDARLTAISELEDPTDAETEEYERLLPRAEELEEALEQLEQAYPDEAKAIAGCILSLDYDGGVRVEAGLVRPEDIPSPQAPATDNADAETPASQDEPGAGTVTALQTNGAVTTAGNSPREPMRTVHIDPPRAIGAINAGTADGFDPAVAKRKEMGLSAALADDLRAIRHQICQAHLAGDFETAFDLNLYSLCLSVFATGYRAKPVDLSVTPAAVHGSADHLKGTVAERMLAAQKKALRLDWLKLSAPEDFNALCALQPRDKRALFAYATSHGLNQQLSIDHGAHPVIEEAGRRMAVDVAACWRPTAANYFGRVKKELSLDVARELIGDQWANNHRGDKKAILAEAMEAAFSEDARERAGLTPGTAGKTARWLPIGMGFAIEEVGSADAETSGAIETTPGEPDADSADDVDGGEGDRAVDGKTVADREDGAREDEEVKLPAFLTEAA